MTLVVLSVLVLGIGVSLGLSGIGGFLIPPLLVTMVGLGPRAAVTDALISFIPSGLVGAALYRRRFSFSWSLSAALCLGVVPGIVIGREVSLSVSQQSLQRILACVVLLAAAVLLGTRPLDRAASERRTGTRRVGSTVRLALVATVGCASGVLTVLAGIGGPLVAVPALVLLGVEAATAVGAALLSSVVGSGLGALALLHAAGDLKGSVLAVVIGVQLLGVTVAVLLRPRIPTASVPQLIGVTAAAAAGWLLWRSFA